MLSAGLWPMAVGSSGPEVAQLYGEGVRQSSGLSRHGRSILHSMKFNCLGQLFDGVITGSLKPQFFSFVLGEVGISVSFSPDCSERGKKRALTLVTS